MEHVASLPLVYFIEAAITPPLIKIGATRGLRHRLDNLRTTNAAPLKLLGVELTEAVPETRERQLHARFARLRTHGEWFRAEARLRTYIQEHTKLPAALPPLYTPGAALPVARYTPQPLVTIEQLAHQLHVAARTIRRWVAVGRVPALRLSATSRVLRFDPAEVLSALGWGLEGNPK